MVLETELREMSLTRALTDTILSNVPNEDVFLLPQFRIMVVIAFLLPQFGIMVVTPPLIKKRPRHLIVS
jgi:hypothetical protein